METPQESMHAVVYTRYGPPEVLQLSTWPKPQPRANEVLVEVAASSVTPGAVWLRRGSYPGSWLFTAIIRVMFGLTGPRKPITGFEFSGTVRAVGDQVTRFRPGDWVYGTTTGLAQGAYAQYVCIPQSWSQGVLLPLPETLRLEEAAVLPIGAMTASHFLQKGGIASGQRVLIYGATGSVGSYAVQLAAFAGAQVTAVCRHQNTDWVQALGAQTVLDYPTWNPADYAQQYDLVFDAVGKLSTSAAKTLLRPGGRTVSVRQMYREKPELMEWVHQALEAGALRPMIDRTYPFTQIQEAHHYAEQGHKRGNVALVWG